MGYLDEIAEEVESRYLGGSGQGGLGVHVLDLINSQETGGLSRLLQSFASKGLGDAVSSWVGTGGNQPVSAEQVANVLGSDRIQEIAQKLGISSADASSGLATLLPRIIDKLTPDGKVPEGGLLEQGLSALKKKLL
jgi:uncharacterized protein YidB (DUF937 family)